MHAPPSGRPTNYHADQRLLHFANAGQKQWFSKLLQNARFTCRVRVRYDPNHMDVSKMIAELQQERAQIEQAILTIERLASGRGKRRGRPPAWMSAVNATGPKRRGRPPGSKNKAKDEA